MLDLQSVFKKRKQNKSRLINYIRLIAKAQIRTILLLLLFATIAALLDGVSIVMLLPMLQSGTFESTEGSIPALISTTLTAVSNRTGTSTFTLSIISICLLILIKFFIKLFEGHAGSLVVTNLFTIWRKELLSLYGKLEYTYYTSKNSGYFANVINAQVNQAAYFAYQLTFFASKLITCIVYVLLAYTINVQFTVIALVSGFGVYTLLRGLMRKTKNVSVRFANENGRLNKFLVQSLQGYKYLKSTGAYGNFQNHVNATINELKSLRYSSGMYTAISQAIQEPIAVTLTLSIIFYVVVVSGQDFSQVIVALLLFYRTMNTLLLLQSTWQGLLSSSGGMELLIEELASASQAQEAHLVTEGDFNPVYSIDSIELLDVWYKYSDKMIINGVSFNVSKRMTVSLVGASGSGKTTLVDLVTGLLKPTSGEIKVSGINLSSLNIESYRSKIGYVTQEPVLFDDTIYNNITMWRGKWGGSGYDSACVEDAARRANCLGFIGELANGFDTLIGERGVKLSGGQKQRIAIARELIKNPHLLILDEATSSLDTESEQLIHESIENIKGTMIILIVAHRLSTIRTSDLVLVIEQGKIAESGTYNELALKETSAFHRMLKMQGAV